jgi:hypothetical protein
MSMLKSLTRTDIVEILALAEQYQRASERVSGGMIMVSPGIYRLDSERQTTHADESERCLYRRIAALCAEARHELTAIMWIGRDGEAPKDIPALVEHARNMSDEGDVAYLTSKEPLAEYLRAGLKRLSVA